MLIQSGSLSSPKFISAHRVTAPLWGFCELWFCDNKPNDGYWIASFVINEMHWVLLVIKRCRDFKILSDITTLQTFRNVCSSTCTHDQAITYISPVIFCELPWDDHKLKSLFPFSLVLIWFWQQCFWRIIFASHTVCYPCDCFVKHSAILLYLVETGIIHCKDSFCKFNKEVLILCSEIHNSLQNRFFLWLTPYQFFFSFHRKN